jgi:hypothetical protein
LGEPWHYSTPVDFIDHWQSLLAGALGFAAAIIAVVLTLRVEQRKLLREMDALRKSLAVELRYQVTRALATGTSLRDLAQGDHPIDPRLLKIHTNFPAPIVYRASADKIGLLQSDSMSVVVVYGLIDLGINGLVLLLSEPDNISSDILEATASHFLAACEHALPLLPGLKTGDPRQEPLDENLFEKIRTALSESAAEA